MAFSGELEFVYEDAFPLKAKRRRACDVCRRTKRRCDGNTVCGHCEKINATCTYMEPVERRHRPKPKRDKDPHLNPQHVKDLNRRLKSAQECLRQRDGNQRIRTPFQVDIAITRLSKPFTRSHPDDSAFLDIADSFRALSLDGVGADPGFQGKSSVAMLVKLALSAKSVPPEIKHACSSPQRSAPPNPRPWTLKSWETPSVSLARALIFPDDYLMETLVSLYFSNVNSFLPLLQRGIFQDGINERLHLHHCGFASTLLLVCTLGSLYLSDVSAQDRHKLARKWYDQVELCGHSLRQQPTLYDLQSYCLAARFLHCTSNPRFAWTIVGFGLRLGEDIGAHRKSGPPISVEKELEKRAMWILLVFDSQLGALLGRGRPINERDVDILLPCELEDEQTEEGAVEFFVKLITLHRLLQFTLSTVHATTLRKRAMGLKDPDVKAVSAELEIALDEWIKSLPSHLIWDPESQSDSAAVLSCVYHHTRILIHRSALTPPIKVPLDIDSPAMTTCADAAEACIRVADTQRRNHPGHPLLFSQTAVFTAGMVLLLIPDTRCNASDNATAEMPDIAHIRAAIDILQAQEQRWPSAAFYATVLERLILPDELPDEDGNMAEDEDEDTGPEGPPLKGVDEETIPPSFETWISPSIPFEGRGDDTTFIPPIFAGDENIAVGGRRPISLKNVS
ncbi:fungal-specific transcription factor domain-containing protein [Mycena polygramma]|nr:fungal-specific transcription factor domain-containing protein [Mycena polygramma]